MHNKNFESLDLKYTYEAVNISIEDFDHIKEIIEGKSLDGFNITIPHKERIIPYLDDLTTQNFYYALAVIKNVKLDLQLLQISRSSLL
jgi:shikimate dehydrogenase